MTNTVEWRSIQDFTSWEPDPTTSSFTFKKPKVHPYYLTSTPWWIINGGLKPMDRNLILFRIGKALGMVS